MACLLAAGAMAACASATQRAVSDPETSPPVEVVIRNRHWHDVRIFALRDGQRHRIGTVTAALTHRFALPPRLLESGRVVRLVAVAAGSRAAITSEVLRVHPGQRIEWTLESDLERSSVAVW